MFVRQFLALAKNMRSKIIKCSFLTEVNLKNKLDLKEEVCLRCDDCVEVQ